MHLARVLVPAQPLATPGEQLLGRDGRAGERDVRHDLLAEPAVGTPDHSGRRDRGVRQQHVLHVAGVDVEATPDDEVLDPVHDVEVAVGIEVADVAGVHPPLAHRQCGGLRVLPVALHHPGRPDAHLAGLTGRHRLAELVDDAQLDAGKRQPHAAGTRCVVRVHGGGRGHLGAAVAVADPHPGHPPFELLPHGDSQRRAAGGEVAQGGQVRGLQVLRQQRLEHRGHERAGLRAQRRGEPEPLGGVEAALEHHEAGLGQLQAGDGVEQPVDVRQGQGQQQVDGP